MIRNYKLFFFLVILLSFILRFYRISDLPHELYVDEVSIGYNAYSILKTGLDEHGKRFPLYFEAFGEYKLPLFIYITSVFQLLLGKVNLAIRLPSVLAGTGTVLILIRLLEELNIKRKQAFSAGLLLAILPWHIHFSRAGFEANLSLFFIIWGSYLLIKGIKSLSWHVLASAILFLVSLYTYYISRLFIPLFLACLAYIFRKHWPALINSKRKIGIAAAMFLLAIPLVSGLFAREGRVRAGTESFIGQVKTNPDIFFTNIPLLTVNQYLKNYFSYFSLEYLFFSGDGQGRHGVREIGPLYLWQMPFLIWGVYLGVKEKKKAHFLMLFILIITPLVAALAVPSPHLLRSLYMVVPISYFSALGFRITFARAALAKGFVMSCLVIYFLFQYLHIYYVHYPKRTSPDWSGGYRETIEYAVKRENNYDKIYITDRMTLGYIYLNYYGNIDPGENKSKFRFVSSPFQERVSGKVLYISPYWEEWEGEKLTEIKNQGGDLVFKIWEN